MFEMVDYQFLADDKVSWGPWKPGAASAISPPAPPKSSGRKQLRVAIIGGDHGESRNRTEV
jgi:hypothetical protein